MLGINKVEGRGTARPASYGMKLSHPPELGNYAIVPSQNIYISSFSSYRVYIEREVKEEKKRDG
jgi:hypothetical protein